MSEVVKVLSCGVESTCSLAWVGATVNTYGCRWGLSAADM